MAQNPPSFIPDSKFVPDTTNAVSQRAPSHVSAPSFIPDDQFVADDEKYSTPGQQAIAGLEGIAGGATLNTSKLLEEQLGFATPEEIKGRAEQNPWTAGIGQVVGGAGLIAATGGAGALAEGAGALGKIGAMAAEGGAFGLGNAVGEYAEGDNPNLDGQKILTHVGMGVGIGGGLGAFGQAIKAAVPAVGSRAASLSKAVKSVYGGAEEAGGAELQPVVADAIVDAPVTGVKPTSYQELANKVAAAKANGEALALPEKLALQDAANRVPMENPIHPLQMDSLDSQEARTAYKTAKQFPGEEGDAIRGYEGLQKNELERKTAQEIGALSQGSLPVSDAVKGGEQAIEAFTNQYQAEKKALVPIFKQLQKIDISSKVDSATSALEKMMDAVPGIARMFDTSVETAENLGTKETLHILPYKTAWGIDKATYNATKEAVTSLLENPKDFEALQNIRRGLDQHVDVLAQGQAPGQIRALKAALMDFMQDVVDKSGASMEVRTAFKRYAINEQERNVIEKVFGASVGSQEFGAISKIKPEVIGDKIFSNTANVKAAKNILEPKEFNKILANWLAEAKVAATDNNAFSGNKFGSFLKKNQDALNEAFKDNPSALQKLKDMTTIMRILPDAAPANPSNTAPTLWSKLKDSKSLMELLTNTAGVLKEKTIGHLEEQVKLKNLNEQLAGRAAKATTLDAVKETVKKTTDQIDKSTKSIFNGNTIRGASTGAAVQLSKDHYEKHSKQISMLSNDPQKLMDHLERTTASLYEAAPKTTQGLNNSIVAGVQFLNSKLPRPNNELPLSTKWEPTNSQKAKFNRYYEAIDNPLNVLKQIKDGSLSNESMEALQSVHPDMLEEMKMKVMENMNPKTAPNLNYSTKIALTKFLGQPLEESMMPQVLMANQASFALMPQSPQSSKGGRPTLGGMKQLDLSSRAKTNTEKLEEDKV